MPPTDHPRPARRACTHAAAVAIALLFLAAPAAGAQPSARPLPLVPAPREAAPLAPFPVGRGVYVEAGRDAEDRFAATELADALRARGVPIASSATGAGVRVRLLRRDTPAGRDALARARLAFDAAMADEGYALVADAGRVDVIGATAAGLFYGAQTVRQLVDGDGARARVLGARVRDWPAMRWRGVHDDISRGPVPTLDYQKRQVRTFAAHKLNVYSPYFENSMSYASHPLVAAPGGAMSREEARDLAAYARRYHVEVIPEQQTFGHLHQVLKWERYSPMAEQPRGHALAPDDSAALPFVRALMFELDTIFPGRFLHVGGDETFELGRGRTAERVRREGLGRVYLDFVTRVAEALRPTGRRLLVWGDLGTNHPELAGALPRDYVAVPWDYAAAPNVERLVAPFRAAGLETWLAPGTSNWWRVYPNHAVGFANVRVMAREGQRLGAAGLLTTTWDDWGEQLFDQTWAGVLFGAAAAWQAGDSDPERFLDAFGRTFHGDTAGHVAAAERALMAAGTLLARAVGSDNNEQPFWIDPWTPEGQRASARVLPVARELRLRAEEAIEHVVRARRTGAVREPAALDAMELGARRLDLIGLKFQLADDVARIYARLHAQAQDSAGAARIQWYDLADVSGINGRLQDLREAYAVTRDLYEAAWRRENRPYWLHSVLARYDVATQLWLRRIDQFTDVRAAFARTRRLPAPAELGIPSPAAAGAGGA
jgi:hexosaminidase